MIPYSKQTIDQADIRAVNTVMHSDYLTTGPQVTTFEQALAKYCQAPYAIAVTNGTAALHLAYLAAGLKKGDEVITTPNTFVATTNMLLAVGAIPVFCDIRLDTYNIDETKIEKLITKKTKAVVPVHFAGQACEMATILKISRKHKLLVIEDGAHALGGHYHGKPIGGLKSDMTTFSFHPVKSITTGEGGAIVTNSKKYYERLRLLRNHGVSKDKKGFNVMTNLGFNYRLTDMQAALGVSQLKKLNRFIKKRGEKAHYYDKRLKKIKSIIVSKRLSQNRSACHLYVIRTARKQDRLKLYRYLLKKNISANFHYPAAYTHPYYKKNKIYGAGPNSLLYHQTAISIPLYPTLTKKEQNYIVGKIYEYFSLKG